MLDAGAGSPGNQLYWRFTVWRNRYERWLCGYPFGARGISAATEWAERSEGRTRIPSELRHPGSDRVYSVPRDPNGYLVRWW